MKTKDFQAIVSKLSSLTRSQIKQAHKALADGLTLREVRDKLKISLSRALKWRHRFLELPKEHQPGPLLGILNIWSQMITQVAFENLCHQTVDRSSN